jgi:hypothetical protein
MRSMNKTSLTFVTAALALSTLASGCAAKKNPARDALNAAKAARAKSEAAAKMDKDISSSGGQPALIELYGAIADPKLQDKQIITTSVTGMGWKGTHPELDSAFIAKLTPEAPATHLDAVNGVEAKYYINVGCDQKTLDAAVVPGTLVEKQLDPKIVPGIRLLQASTVVICGTNKLIGGQLTEIKATNVYMFTSDNAMTEGAKHERSLFVLTRDLYLNGENKISSIVPAGDVTPDGGSSILSITVTGQVKGDGKLTIYSEGSSYKEDPNAKGKKGKHGHGGGPDAPGGDGSGAPPSGGDGADGTAGGSGGHHHHGHGSKGGQGAPEQPPQDPQQPSPQPPQQQPAQPQQPQQPAPAQPAPSN